MGQAERRRHERTPYTSVIEFVVLSMQVDELRRMRSSGTTVDRSEGGVGIITKFPLEPGQVLEWDDRHERGKLHLALVKWCRRGEDGYRAGLRFI